MRVYKEVNYGYDFDFWSGAETTRNYLLDSEINTIVSMLEECYPDGMSETEFNDFFWFEDDTIAEWLGWPDFDTLMKARSGDHWFETFKEWEEAQENEEGEEGEEE